MPTFGFLPEASGRLQRAAIAARPQRPGFLESLVGAAVPTYLRRKEREAGQKFEAAERKKERESRERIARMRPTPAKKDAMWLYEQTYDANKMFGEKEAAEAAIRSVRNVFDKASITKQGYTPLAELVWPKEGEKKKERTVAQRAGAKFRREQEERQLAREREGERIMARSLATGGLPIPGVREPTTIAPFAQPRGAPAAPPAIPGLAPIAGLEPPTMPTGIRGPIDPQQGVIQQRISSELEKGTPRAKIEADLRAIGKDPAQFRF